MEKKKSRGSLVVIIILVILLFGACAYIGYDKFFVKEKANIGSVKNNKKEENLDVNSRLVQSLYNKVSTGLIGKSSSCRVNYMYGHGDNDNSFYSDKADEQQKMGLVGNLLSESFESLEYDGDSNLIPDTINTTSDYLEYNSIYAMNRKYNENKAEIFYTKDYVEMIYKSIFGKDAKLDTSVPIIMSFYKGELYYYVSALDKYVLYVADGIGGECPEEAYAELVRATKDDKALKIYEKITTINLDSELTESGKKTETNYVYTFELEDDGMYKFVSRVKKD